MAQVLNKRYELGPKVGDGGMAVVYQARDLVLGRTVAIKVLRDQYVADEAFLSRFEREAQSAASLSHPNVVNIYDVGQDGSLYYIVMEFVPGRSLKDLIRAEGPLRTRQTIELGRQICAALSYAHQRGLVHRDIKPQNILVTPEGLVKVADFGIAKGMHDAHLTATGVAMGTVHYAAPEQVEGKDATPASDIYAVGVVLYEMLTGRLPFEGETPVSIALKHINEAPPRIRTLNPQVPPGVEAVVLTALSKNPEDRFTDASDLSQALADYQQFSPQAAAVRGSTARTATVPVQRVAVGGRATGSRVALDPRTSTVTRTQVATPPVRRSAGGATPRDEVGCLTWAAGVVALGVLLGLLLAAFNVLPRVLNTGQSSPPPTVASTPLPIVQVAQRTPTPAGKPTSTRVPALALSATPTATGTPTPTPSPSPSPTPSPTPPPPTATPVPRLPSLLSRTFDEAQQLVEPLGVTVTRVEPGVFSERIPAGHIAEQSPEPNVLVQPGTTVRVTLSRGQPVEVPDLRNQEAALATRFLTERGLQVRVVEESNRGVAANRVIRTEPPAGTAVEAGTTVTLIVSLGDQVRVPDVFGKPLPEAQAMLESAGLKLGTVSEQTRGQVPPSQRDAFDQVAPGAVLSATPNYGTLVARGTEVQLAIRKPQG